MAYSLATALFGGFTPAVSTYLIQVSGNRAVAGLWLMFAAACGLIAALLAWKPQFAERGAVAGPRWLRHTPSARPHVCGAGKRTLDYMFLFCSY